MTNRSYLCTLNMPKRSIKRKGTGGDAPAGTEEGETADYPFYADTEGATHMAALAAAALPAQEEAVIADETAVQAAATAGVVTVAVRHGPMREVMPTQKWLSCYEEVKQFKQEHGNFSAPKNNKKLASWIRTQKQQYALLQQGKANHMSQARLDLLNEIGFTWARGREGRDKVWNERYDELVAFRAKNNGSTRIPQDYKVFPQLYAWTTLQRRQLKMWKEGKPHKLTDERIQLLEAVGLESNIRSVCSWMDRFVSTFILRGSLHYICSFSFFAYNFINFHSPQLDTIDGTEAIQGRARNV